jgi:hypothetical protein
MTMLEIALDCIRRGWYVFPCWPKTKKPMTKNGYKDATDDEFQVRQWWGKDDCGTNANVAIATGPSGLFVTDFDYGFEDATELRIWMEAHGIPETYAVLTGRDGFGVQLYYTATGLKSSAFQLDDGVKGDIRCGTGYVMAAGCIHPSGRKYATLWGIEPQPAPEVMKKWTEKAVDRPDAITVDDATADEWKTWLLEYLDRNELQYRDFEKRVSNGYWLGIRCPWEHEHSSGAGAESSTVLGILDGWLAFECSHGTCKAAGRDTQRFRDCVCDTELEPGVGPSVQLGTGLPNPRSLDAPETWEGIGGPEDPEAWRKFFCSKDDLLNCPDPTFLIRDFLSHQSICAIAAPVGQRKSLIALNMVWALCTGNDLFGFLKVEGRPSRVLYMCPEMGRISLKGRIKKIGLVDALDDMLFIRTMNEGTVEISDVLKLPDRILLGSVVILDTAIRFMEGDELSAKDMKAFSNQIFELLRKMGDKGAIVILYHSPKATKEAFELTLENCLRGSGELGAAVTDAHGTRLQPLEVEGQDGWDAKSFIKHVKDRDYPGAQDFEVTCDRATGLMSRVGDLEVRAVLNTKKPGPKTNPAEDAAMDAIIETHLKKDTTATVPVLMAAGKDGGIKASKTRWTERRQLVRERLGLPGGAKLKKG